MIFLEYVGSRACLSAVTLVKSIFYGRFFISESKIKLLSVFMKLGFNEYYF